jgi:hypothetical protein
MSQTGQLQTHALQRMSSLFWGIVPSAFSHREKENQSCDDKRESCCQFEQVKISSSLQRFAQEQDGKHRNHDADKVPLEIFEVVDFEPARQWQSIIDEQHVKAEADHEATMAIRKTSIASSNPTASALPGWAKTILALQHQK